MQDASHDGIQSISYILNALGAEFWYAYDIDGI